MTKEEEKNLENFFKTYESEEFSSQFQYFFNIGFELRFSQHTDEYNSRIYYEAYLMGDLVHTSYAMPLSYLDLESIKGLVQAMLRNLNVLYRTYFLVLDDEGKNTVSREDAVSYAYYLCDLAMRLNNLSFKVDINLSADTLIIREAESSAVETIPYDHLTCVNQMRHLLYKISESKAFLQDCQEGSKNSSNIFIFTLEGSSNRIINNVDAPETENNFFLDLRNS